MRYPVSPAEAAGGVQFRSLSESRSLPLPKMVHSSEYVVLERMGVVGGETVIAWFMSGYSLIHTCEGRAPMCLSSDL